MPRGVHTSDRPSGFQQRKVKKNRMREDKVMAESMLQFVSRSSKQDPEHGIQADSDWYTDSEPYAENVDSQEVKTEIVSRKEIGESDDNFQKSLKDVSFWVLPVSDALRVEIVKVGSGPFQNKEGPFQSTSRNDQGTKGFERNLTQEWFFKSMPNRERILRSWMVFSPITGNLYCFCCRLFTEHVTVQT